MLIFTLCIKLHIYSISIAGTIDHRQYIRVINSYFDWGPGKGNTVCWYNVFNFTVNQALESIDLYTNKEFGFVEVNLEKFRSLPPVIGERVLRTLALHMGGARVEVHYKSLARAYGELQKDFFKPHRIGRSIIYSPRRRNNMLVVGRVLPDKKFQDKLLPISVGETVYWDGRWKITLKSRQDVSYRGEEREQLYIRPMRPSDSMVPRRGIRRIRSARLPDELIRGGLPMISNKDGYVVLAPHFRVADRSYGVFCDVSFDPLLPLKQDTEVHVC